MYTITAIGGVGGPRSEAFAINAVGAVAGTAMEANARPQGFAYQNALQSFGPDTEARGINSAGAIVGTQGAYATVWKLGSVVTLGSLGGGESVGLGINDLGDVTGASPTVEGFIRAFLYTDGRMLDLGTLGGQRSVGVARERRLPGCRIGANSPR